MKKFSFVGLRRWWFALSVLSIVASLGALAAFGLKFSIDFTGGSLIELAFVGDAPASADITAVLAESGEQGVTVQSAENNRVIVRLPALSEDQHQAVLATLHAKFGDFSEDKFDSIGPVIGNELRKSALLGLVTTLVLIGLYVSWAFRKVSEPVASWKYGLLTMFCAAHDVIIPLGVFAVIGHYWHWEVGTAFVAAMLTILGYSISDTVVVFDRTRENLSRNTGEPFATIVERSIQQTYVRSINTSVTVLLALASILVFGGESTQPFALALLIGVLVGTYSSIFFASPALVEWEEMRKK